MRRHAEATDEGIKEAIVAALRAGDCGYRHVEGLGPVFAEFAADPLSWSPESDLVFAIPDVMSASRKSSRQ